LITIGIWTITLNIEEKSSLLWNFISQSSRFNKIIWCMFYLEDHIRYQFNKSVQEKFQYFFSSIDHQRYLHIDRQRWREKFSLMKLHFKIKSMWTWWISMCYIFSISIWFTSLNSFQKTEFFFVRFSSSMLMNVSVMSVKRRILLISNVGLKILWVEAWTRRYICDNTLFSNKMQLLFLKPMNYFQYFSFLS
jgi:hypothetical protein